MSKMKKFMEKLNFYLENTTLHGFSYISGGRHWIEKIFWMLAILCSSICCFILFYEIILKIEHNPVIVYQPDNAEHIKNVPFPAVSVCPEFSLSNKYEIVTSFLKDKHPFDLDQCYNNVYSYKCMNLDSNLEVRAVLDQIYLDFQIEWLRKFQGTDVITFSSYGWCNTFNIINDTKIFYENSIASYFNYKESYRSNLIGSVAELQHSTQSPPLFSTKSDFGLHGFIFDADLVTIVIHSPFETPDSRHRSFVLMKSEISRLSIEPIIKITDETLLDQDVDERRCYKPEEHQLQYFKTYTSINCLRECESSFILQKCGCVPYYFISNDTSLICSTTQLDCFNREYEGFDEVKCRCYPPCEDTTYEFMMQKFSTHIMDVASEIVVKFKHDYFYPQIKRKYFTMIDWFSFVGGILGLFFGFSFLSAFEMIFHVTRGLFGGKTIRIFKNKRLFGEFRQKIRKYKKVLRVAADSEQFMKESSIHSFRYIFGSDLRIIERIAWTISFILSITACSFMIQELKDKYSINSVSIVSMNDYINISQVPFPAITLMSNALMIHDEYKVDTNEEIAIGRIISRNEDKRENFEHEMSEILSIPEHLKNLSNYGHKIIPYAREFFDRSHLSLLELVWNKEYSVNTAETITNMIIGHSFNILPSDELFVVSSTSDDFLYKLQHDFKGGDKTDNLKYPLKPSFMNHESFEVNQVNNRYFEHIHTSIHSNHEYPMQIISDKISSFRLNKPKKLEFLIIPEIVMVEETFEDLDFNYRNCYLDNERKLKFFKIYTQRNCEIECLSGKLFKSCDCVPFDIIRSKDTKICDLRDYDCVDKVKNESLYDENSCNCLEQCSYISYSFEIITIKHLNKTDAGTIKYRFKNNEFTALQRVRQFTIFDFLSYIGGLLGLFAGISVLSLFEIFYFFTLRFICEILRFKMGQKRVGCENYVVIVAPKTKDRV